MRGPFDVVLVGGGPDALAAAALLTGAGRRALVVTEPRWNGGMLGEAEIAPGARFPVAPETLPGPDPSVIEALGLPDHGLELLAPDPVLTVVSRGGEEPFALLRDPERARLAVAGLSVADAVAFGAFNAELGHFAGFLRRLLTRPPLGFDSGAEDALPAVGAALRLGRRRLPDLLQMLPMAVRDLLDDRFESQPLKAALAGPALTGIRLGPRAPGTAGMFLHFHAFAPGGPLGWIRPPRGGAAGLGRALRRAARAAGARFATEGGGVRRILVERVGGALRARGVELRDGRTIAAPVILSDASPRTTLLEWTEPSALSPDFTREARRIRYRGTAARIGLLLSGLPRLRGGDPPESDPRLRGVIQIGASLDDLEQAADAAKYGEVAADPLVFACLPSLHAAGFAPDGHHLLTATVQTVPWTDGPDPARRADAILRRAIAALEVAFPGLADLVIGHRVLTPALLERDFGLVEGSFHQGEPTMDQLFSLRPVPGYSGHRTPVAGLYLAGPGTYPYGGLHGVSGRNAAAIIRRDAGESVA